MKITLHEVARLLSVPEATVYGWIRTGAIPVTQVHEQYRFNRAEVFEWATERGLPVSVELLQAAAGDSSPRLADALAAGGIHHDVGGDDPASVLRAVVDLMPPWDGLEDRELLLDILICRKALGITPVGDGIAIPHVQSPIVLPIPTPSVALCFLARPVDLGAHDGLPVSTLFSVIAPTTRAHLHLLSRIAAALFEPRFRELVARRAPADEILAAAREVEARLSAGSAGGGAPAPGQEVA